LRPDKEKQGRTPDPPAEIGFAGAKKDSLQPVAFILDYC